MRAREPLDAVRRRSRAIGRVGDLKVGDCEKVHYDSEL